MTKWEAAQGNFRSFDGTVLFYRSWKQEPAANRALIVIHRGHEHSGRVGDLVEELDLQDVWVFSWDCRGTACHPENVVMQVATMIRLRIAMHL